MKKIPLLPRYFNWIGLLLILLFVVNYIYSEHIHFPMLAIYDSNPSLLQDGNNRSPSFFSVENRDMGLTNAIAFSILGLSFIAFSKEKMEDEMINSIRLYSWSWSIICILVFSILSTLFIYGTAYLSFVFYYLQLLLIIYIVIFKYHIWKMNRRA